MAVPATLEDVVAAINDLEATTTTLLTENNDKLNTIIALLQVGNSIPAATILAQEFYNRQDLDLGGGSGDTVTDDPPPNNSIYGTTDGFQIDETDPLFPIVLESVHSHPSFEFPAIIITFNEYLATL
jgi:hypothetical protein